MHTYIFHKDSVLKAMKAGKNVYCDKPLATSFEETKEIADLLENAEVITQMALQYRFFLATMRAKELIEHCKISRVISFRACYLHSDSVDAKRK